MSRAPSCDAHRAGKMSPRSPSLSEGEIASEDEEKAISTNARTSQDSPVNSSARLHLGSSSRSAQTQPAKQEANGLMGDTDSHFDAEGNLRKSREASRSPYRCDRSRSGSTYHASKQTSGDKRRHEHDHYSRKGGSDPRRFKVHYESTPQSRDSGHHRSRHPYIDPDRPLRRKDEMTYGDRGSSNPSKRNRDRDRDRSRSPFRHSRPSSRNGSQRDTSDRQSTPNRRGSDHGVTEHTHARTPFFDSRESTPTTSHGQDNAKSKQTKSQQVKSEPEHDENARDEQAKASLEDTNESKEQLSEADLIEQRRKKREAIKARHKGNPPLLVQALQHNLASAPPTPMHDSSGGPSEQQSPPSSASSPQTPHKDSPPGSPAAFAVTHDEELVDRRDHDGVANDEGPSAADYDPNLDMEEDRPEHKRHILQGSAVNDTNGYKDDQSQENAPKQSKEFDMFADDDDDDMFAPVDSTAKPAVASAKQARALDESLLDNWDYPDGHYRITLGELLDGRYAVQQQIGKGTFATVVRAQDTTTGSLVAIKIACNNETMYKAGQKEMDMLQLLNENDADDKKHIIRLLRHFDHKGHLCLVFENLSADLREVLKKFGRNVGLNLKAIRSYAQQMFLALSHLKKCNILHADLKPDNILVSEKRSLLKVCDLGTAAFVRDAEITPYLVSRFYRAPEVILGMEFDYAIDMWSIGCTLFELYTGRILFAGADNNQMLRAIQECRGKFPIRILKRSTLADKHFDMDGNFFSQERDKLTGKATMRQVNFNKTMPGKDLRSRLSVNIKGMKTDEIREHAAFVDLMEKCLQLDPAKRVSPNEALRHSFIAHSMAPAHAEKTAPSVKVAMNVPGRMK